MNNKRLVPALIVDIVGTQFTYQACADCFCKLLHCNRRKRWTCSRCQQEFSINEIYHRYRLSMRVYMQGAYRIVTVFGKSVEHVFGTSAVEFYKFAERLKIAPVVVIDSLKNLLIGKTFLFGLSGPGKFSGQQITAVQMVAPDEEHSETLLKRLKSFCQLTEATCVLPISPLLVPTFRDSTDANFTWQELTSIATNPGSADSYLVGTCCRSMALSMTMSPMEVACKASSHCSNDSTLADFPVESIVNIQTEKSHSTSEFSDWNFSLRDIQPPESEDLIAFLQNCSSSFGRQQNQTSPTNNSNVAHSRGLNCDSGLPPLYHIPACGSSMGGSQEDMFPSFGSVSSFGSPCDGNQNFETLSSSQRLSFHCVEHEARDSAEGAESVFDGSLDLFGDLSIVEQENLPKISPNRLSKLAKSSAPIASTPVVGQSRVATEESLLLFSSPSPSSCSIFSQIDAAPEHLLC